MTKCINCNCFTSKLYLTYCTINYVIVRTVVYTVGSNVVFNYHVTICMTKCINCFLCNKNFVTYGTVFTLCQTCCCTCRSNCFVNYFLVSVSRNCNLCAAEFNFTNCTVNYVFPRTDICTICINLIFNYHVAICMTKSCNCFLCNKNFVTYGTVFTFCQTCCCTSRCYCFVNYFCVTKCINHYCFTAKFNFTNCTVNYVIIRTVVYTVGSNVVFNYHVTICMTKSCNLVCYIRMTANCTCVCCISTVYTIGSSYYCIVIVTESINRDCFTSKLYVTYCTVNYVIVRTVVYTVGSNVVFNNHIAFCMTKCRNCFLCNKNFVTYGTM